MYIFLINPDVDGLVLRSILQIQFNLKVELFHNYFETDFGLGEFTQIHKVKYSIIILLQEICIIIKYNAKFYQVYSIYRDFK